MGVVYASPSAGAIGYRGVKGLEVVFISIAHRLSGLFARILRCFSLQSVRIAAENRLACKQTFTSFGALCFMKTTSYNRPLFFRFRFSDFQAVQDQGCPPKWKWKIPQYFAILLYFSNYFIIKWKKIQCAVALLARTCAEKQPGLSVFTLQCIQESGKFESPM